MNYLELIQKAFLLPWKFKYLWWLGILALFASGGGGNQINYSLSSSDLQNLINQEGEKTSRIKEVVPQVLGASTTSNFDNFLSQNWYWIGGLILVLILAFVILMIIGIMANAGLISAVAKIEKKMTSSFSDAIREGKKYFWRLVAFSLIVGGGFVLVLVVIFLPNLLLFMTSILIGFIYFFPALIVTVIFAIYVKIYSLIWLRTLIINKEKFFPAFKLAFKKVNKNFKKIIILFLLDILSSFIYSLVAFLVFLIIALPFILIAVGIGVAAGLTTGIIIGAFALLLAVVALLFLGGYYQGYISAFWTLGYLEIEKK